MRLLFCKEEVCHFVLRLLSLVFVSRSKLISTLAGLVQVVDAINAKTLISPFELQLNDTAYFKGAQTITLENRNPYAVKYTFSHVASRSLGVYDKAAKTSVLPSLDPQEVSAVASVTFGARVVTVAAGKTASVKVTIKAPTISAATASRFPVYSGFLIVNQAASGQKGQRYTGESWSARYPGQTELTARLHSPLLWRRCSHV